MTELIALAKLSVNRYRFLLTCMTSLIALGLLGTLFSMQTFGEEIGMQVGTYAIFFCLLPSGVSAIALFDYGLDHDLSQADTGCSDWLLRQPIRSWKIATIPIVFKTAWISTIWISLAVFVRNYSSEPLPIVLPCISFSAVLTWIMVLSWRPFTHGFYKLVALLAAIPVSYCIVAAGFVSPFLENESWRPLAVLASWIVSILFFIGAVWCLLRATNLARYTPQGALAASARAGVSMATDPTDEVTAYSQFLTPRNETGSTEVLRAILWHDYAASREWVKQIYLMGVIPGTCLFALITPLHPVSIIGMFFGIIYLAIIINSKHLLQNNPSKGAISSGSHLPIYLASKPIQTKVIAWGRQILPLVLASCTYLWVFVVIAGWSLKETNRVIWIKWASTQANRIGQPEHAFEVGFKLSAATVLIVGILFLTRIISNAWVPATGRAWITITNAFAAIIYIFAPIIIFIRWFLSQTDWESTEREAIAAFEYLPSILASLLFLKCLLTITVSYFSLRRQLIALSDLAWTICFWTVAVLTSTLIFRQLLPYEFATWQNCFLTMSLIFPISRWIGLPLALAHNRHR